jgi:hypothetical protein
VHPKYWDQLFSGDGEFVIVDPSLFPAGKDTPGMAKNPDGTFELPAKELNWERVWSSIGAKIEAISPFKEPRKKTVESFLNFMVKGTQGKSGKKFGQITASFLVKLFGMYI